MLYIISLECIRSNQNSILWHKNRHTDKCNRIESPEITFQIHSQQTFDESDMKVAQWGCFATPRTIQSMEFSRPEYWSGLPCPPPGDLPNAGTEPRSPALQVDSLPAEPPGKPTEKTVSSINGAGKAGYSQKNETRPLSPLTQKINSKRIKDSNIRPEIIKLLDGNKEKAP